MLEHSTALFETEDCGESLVSPRRWGVRSETGRLREVLLAAPSHLTAIPCNTVARTCIAEGHRTSTAAAQRQHRGLIAALEQAGVTCRLVEARMDLPDLAFTRDAVTMTPWGAIGLRPALDHRREETNHVLACLRSLGMPIAGRVDRGRVEGGDVCLVRDGLAMIAISEERTDEAGAHALGAMFEQHGWRAIYTRIEPEYLHLDTVLTMVADDCAVACVAALPPRLVTRLDGLGISIIEAELDDCWSLGANLLSLGGGRLVASAPSPALRAALERRGLSLIDVELSEFTSCGGGPHCLTLPLARDG